MANTRRIYLARSIKESLVGEGRTVEVVGRCMEPAIWDGSMVVVDTGREPVPGDVVIVLHPEHGPMVKRLRCVRGDVLGIGADSPRPEYRDCRYAVRREHLFGVVVARGDAAEGSYFGPLPAWHVLEARRDTESIARRRTA